MFLQENPTVPCKPIMTRCGDRRLVATIPNGLKYFVAETTAMAWVTATLVLSLPQDKSWFHHPHPLAHLTYSPFPLKMATTRTLIATTLTKSFDAVVMLMLD